MNSNTLTVLKSIGSPFVNDFQPLDTPVESLDLYNYAFKNHIGLVYLNSLRSTGCLNSLNAEYEKLRHRYDETLVTVGRIGGVLESEGHHYVITKTLKPFLATPNDVDVLYMGSRRDYERAIELLKRKGYTYLHRAPMQAEFYDPRAEKIRGDKKGGIYHIDLYRDACADYVNYFDKQKLEPYITEQEVLGTVVRVFRPEAELAITLMHGVFPEQSYQMQDFYTTLCFLNEMKEEDVKEFVHIVTSNHVRSAISASLSITAQLHSVVFRSIPDKLNYILERIGKHKLEIEEFQQRDFQTPYRYKFRTFLSAFLERGLDPRGFQSYFIQGFYMLNPLFFWDVVKVVKEKQKRGTYHQV